MNATATINPASTKAVTKTIIVFEEQPETVTLTLTRKQAETLAQVFYSIGGNPAGSRGDVDSISAALSAAGIYRSGAPKHGNIYFED